MDSSASLELSKQILFSFGLVLAAGTVSGFLSQRIKVPDVVIFLLAGILLGPEITGLLHIKAESALNQIILIFGSCYILFDGGASLRFKVLKEVWITIAALSTVGVVIMTFITGLAAFYIMGIPFTVALLLGASTASTDPATLVPILRKLHIRERVSQTVIGESAFNDVISAIVTFGVLAVAMGSGEFSFGTSFISLLKQSIVGVVAGGLMGYLAALFIAHEKFNFLAEYAPVVTLMAVIGAYLGSENFHASGFMAVFVFGIVIGNKESFGFYMSMAEQKTFRDYVFTTAFIMRMFIFILLGSQVDFSLVNRYLGGGVAVVTIFMLVSRPLTVFLCALPDRRARWSINEIIFMCWTRETGVIPAALAGLLMGLNAPGSRLIASVIFIAILMTLFIQATTTRWLAGRLRLLEKT
ncbi:MAG: sodium:proton antiporter [Nitrospirae bacterium]|nr:sodium:proton antiporter [Nitrospirota bacterium]